jgi:hypothetical protein
VFGTGLLVCLHLLACRYSTRFQIGDAAGEAFSNAGRTV